ncbi:MAG TPA: transcriptional regulator [Alphaproteobacteria bacterium]|nr:transcriptional regulator [Alphaproteobacteria bacterium]HAJ48370.1 transcriptional regulator [Alphaproteobacteria bacterium]
MRTFVVLNPRSGNGRTGRHRTRITARIAEAVGPITIGETRGPMDAASLTQQALLEGYELIVSVGGDGTLNEVVNGFFRNGGLINPDASLALVTVGTGGDFRRTFGIADGLDESLARLKQGKDQRIDIGRLSFVTDDGKPQTRYFANIASFGLSGEVVRRVNRARWTKLLGGTFAFRWAALRAATSYQNRPVRLKVDAAFDRVVPVSTVCVCNGRFFGGGMMIAPDAVPDDGLFDVIILGDAPQAESLSVMRMIYKGEHVRHPSVTVLRGRSVIATPVEATGGASVFLDVDGEGPGKLPAVFEILPQIMRFRH